MTSMAYKRERAAAVVLDGYIYAIGGHSGFQLMNTVERLVKFYLFAGCEGLCYLKLKQSLAYFILVLNLRST